MGEINKRVMEETHPILTQHIDLIVTSDELHTAFKLNGFQCIGEIIQFKAFEILEMPGFNVRLLMQLYSLLKYHNLEMLIKE